MKVLVIGGAGYFGSTLARECLARGHQVTVLDALLFGGESLIPLLQRPQFNLISGDLRDEATLARAIAGQDAVCLLAAIVGEPACNRDPVTAVATNLDGARGVLAGSKRAGVSRFVLASTCSNYGVSEPQGLVNEEAPLQPISTYSETKVAAEKDTLVAANREFHPTVLRFGTAFGVSARMRFDLLVSDFALAAVRDRRVVVYGEQFWRPFVHIRDMSQAVLRVLEAEPSEVSGEVFNVGSNAANTQKITLAEQVRRLIPGTELEFVKRDTDPRSYRVDFSKIRSRLGFRAEWSIEDGIGEVHDALKAGVWARTDDPRFYN